MSPALWNNLQNCECSGFIGQPAPKKNLSSQLGLASLTPKWWGSGRGLAITGPTTVGSKALKNSSSGKGALKQKKQILAQLEIEEKAGWLLGGRQLNLMGFSG